MSNETVKIPAKLWTDIKDLLAPHARKLMDAKGMYEDFPELYDVLSRIRDFDEFHSPDIDNAIFGVSESVVETDNEIPYSEMAEVLDDAINVMDAYETESENPVPDFVTPMTQEYWNGLPEHVQTALSNANSSETFSTDAVFYNAPAIEETSKIDNLKDAIIAIHAMFDKVKENGNKRITYRSTVVTLSAAGDNSSNPGMLYVKDNRDNYVGKLGKSGYFKPPFNKLSSLTLQEMTDALIDIANDPKGIAVRYGHMTGKCSMCGAELTDPESIKRSMGPICAAKWSW